MAVVGLSSSAADGSAPHLSVQEVEAHAVLHHVHVVGHVPVAARHRRRSNVGFFHVASHFELLSRSSASMIV